MASSPQYIAGRSWEAEDDRLSALERALDPATRRHLERLGIAKSARCLEVGAGGGSIAAWMASVVGSHGCVVVTDIDTALLEDRFRNHRIEDTDFLWVAVGEQPVYPERVERTGHDVHGLADLLRLGQRAWMRLLAATCKLLSYFTQQIVPSMAIIPLLYRMGPWSVSPDGHIGPGPKPSTA